jgi:hypothetical protein
MSWVLDHIGLIVFFAIAYSLWRKARKFLKQVTEETERRGRTRSTANDPEEAQRVRRIQEEIRRKIAERRGSDQRGQNVPRSTSATPPVLRPAEASTSDSVGGTVRRVMAELERRIEATVPAQIPEPIRRDAQLERQEQLAAELRSSEEARVLAARRTTQTAAAAKMRAESEGGMLVVSRGNLLADLRDPRSLRRAFVLREVLGSPVGLR